MKIINERGEPSTEYKANDNPLQRVVIAKTKDGRRWESSIYTSNGVDLTLDEMKQKLLDTNPDYPAFPINEELPYCQETMHFVVKL